MDWNNDGLHDLLVGNGDGHVHLFLNRHDNSDPILEGGSIIQAGGTEIDVGMRAAPIVNDWNEDGRKDLLIGNFEGTIHVYLNEGTNAEPDFATSYLLVAGGNVLDIGSRAAPRIFDWNDDGLKDILIGELEGYVYYLKNVASNDNPAFNRAEKLFLKNGNPLRFPSSKGVPRSRLYIADWNNDGQNDVLVGGVDGKVMLFRAASGSTYTVTDHLNKSLNLSVETLKIVKKIIKSLFI